LYRKFSAGNIFTGYQLLEAGNVLITGTTGKVIEIVSSTDAGDDVQQFEGILSPGFINAHCHLELSHMKGFIPEHTGLVDFVLKIIFDRHFGEEEITAAIEKADNEMFNNGIVAVGDICNTALTIAQKQKSKLRYYNFIETSGFPPAVAASRFERSVAIYNAYKEYFPDTSVVPHAPYSVSPELFSMIDAFPGNKVITIHNQETAAENELFEKGKGDFTRLYEKLNIDMSFFKPSGKTSIQTYWPYLNRHQSLILVHNVHTSSDDTRFIQQQAASSKRPTFFCFCPNANLYISNTLPDMDLFLQPPPGSLTADGLVLGTDSLASNHQLGIVEEMRTLQQHFPLLTTEILLQWATINGARALQMENELGSFEKGKTPGIVLITETPGKKLSGASVAKRIL
jgi:aminodeoxyfutalosine deaminase